MQDSDIKVEIFHLYVQLSSWFVSVYIIKLLMQSELAFLNQLSNG